MTLRIQVWEGFSLIVGEVSYRFDSFVSKLVTQVFPLVLLLVRFHWNLKLLFFQFEKSRSLRNVRTELNTFKSENLR